MAAVALANGLNANLLRRWVQHDAGSSKEPAAPSAAPGGEFIPLALAAAPTPVAGADIRIELKRGTTTVTVNWPARAAGECAAWLREWLR